jgi:type IV secretory pathway VirB2 component (pilin)
MIIAAIIYRPSLTDPSPAGVLASAATWVTDLMFGPLATTIAVIAVAWIGFAMLSGRIDIKRGLSVVFGCFLLFGARGMVDALGALAGVQAVPQTANMQTVPNHANSRPQANNTNGYDPYAGASVMSARQ